MKKVKKIIKNNVKVLIAFILGGIILGTGGVYAATVINASDVSYSNASSGMTSTNVQGAIEELYNDSKKNLDFIDETVGTDFAHDVFASYYSDACLKGKMCTWYKLGLSTVMNTCASTCSDRCKSSCMDSCTDGAVCSSKCSSICGDMCTPNPENPNNDCYNKGCGKDQEVMVNLDNGCSEKCSNNDACYKSCFRKAVGNDTCSDFYLANK